LNLRLRLCTTLQCASTVSGPAPMYSYSTAHAVETFHLLAYRWGFRTRRPARPTHTYMSIWRPGAISRIALILRGLSDIMWLCSSCGSRRFHPDFGTFGLNFGAEGAPLLYVFDFDQTILRIHSFGSRIRPEVRRSRRVAMFPAEVDSPEVDLRQVWLRSRSIACGKRNDRVQPTTRKQRLICILAC